ncbi:MAG: hypothetical protein AAF810_07145 [Cyanobacteria bacterium P01_D01_bin.36]
MANIKVDQSHCNFHLSNWLSRHHWDILFTDAGRVSRGGTGSQGSCLKIFEEESLPIPDIVAYKGEKLIFIEIDSNFGKAKPSLEKYDTQKSLIIKRFISDLSLALSNTSLYLGFCRTGIVQDSRKYLEKETVANGSIDFWIYFEAPRVPVLYWPNDGVGK